MPIRHPDWSTPLDLGSISGVSYNAGGDFFGGAVDVSGKYAVVGAESNSVHWDQCRSRFRLSIKQHNLDIGCHLITECFFRQEIFLAAQ